MAMTIRLPADLDARLDALAEQTHTSKHAVVVQAVEAHIDRQLKTAAVIESLDETSRDYAELIRRLEDA